MRCVACNRALSPADLLNTKPGTNEPEDMCARCRFELVITTMDSYDPSFRQFDSTIRGGGFKIDQEGLE